MPSWRETDNAIACAASFEMPGFQRARHTSPLDSDLECPVKITVANITVANITVANITATIIATNINASYINAS